MSETNLLQKIKLFGTLSAIICNLNKCTFIVMSMVHGILALIPVVVGKKIKRCNFIQYRQVRVAVSNSQNFKFVCADTGQKRCFHPSFQIGES